MTRAEKLDLLERNKEEIALLVVPEGMEQLHASAQRLVTAYANSGADIDTLADRVIEIDSGQGASYSELVQLNADQAGHGGEIAEYLTQYTAEATRFLAEYYKPNQSEIPQAGADESAESAANDAQGIESPEGRSHKGESLYFTIATGESTKVEAQKKLDDALSKFDVQMYFIVRKSDDFDVMRPGWWIVAEASKNKPSKEDVQSMQSRFPGAYVKKATVLTDEPIPVYEDMVEGAD